MQVPYTSFYLGPFAVYNSPTGIINPITGVPSLGGTLHEGDYCDLSSEEAADWNVKYGSNLFAGRYRFTRLSPNATSANLAFGKPVGFGLGTTVAQAIVAAGGTGYTIAASGLATGNVTISSTTSGGTAVATANLTLSAGVITGVQLLYGGAGFTSVPTFSLSELASGSGGSVLARQSVSPNFISSLDSSAVSLYQSRGVILASVTAAQITSGAWVVIQEQGIANVIPTVVTTATAGNIAYISATAGAVTVSGNITAGTTPLYAGLLGYTLDAAVVGAPVRVNLQLAPQQG